jgi:hypothetical protein
MIRVGDRGRAVTELRPTGAIEVYGRRIEAKADRLHYVPTDAEVVVVGGDAFGVIVRTAATVADPVGLPNYGETVPLTLQEAAARNDAAAKAHRDEHGLDVWSSPWVWPIIALDAAICGSLGWWWVGDVGLIVGLLIGFLSLPLLAVLLSLFAEP